MLESEIRNGHPWSVSTMSGWTPHGEDAALLADLPAEDQQKVFKWIEDNLLMTEKTPDRYHSSYGLKQTLTRETGVYVTNNQFKDAMLLSGYVPVKVNELNWHFYLSRKSPAFHRKW